MGKKLLAITKSIIGKPAGVTVQVHVFLLVDGSHGSRVRSRLRVTFRLENEGCFISKKGEKPPKMAIAVGGKKDLMQENHRKTMENICKKNMF